ncbi:MAG: META domain-containing protein [Bacteroidales bacterium]|nr:META domain-containing protein [Bacteroidales bacterium]
MKSGKITIIVFLSVMMTVTASSCSLLGKNTASSNQTSGQPSTSASKAKPASTLPADIAGEWSITQVGDIKVTGDEDLPYLTFVPGEGRFYSSNGCNVLNGAYALEGNVLKFRNVAATMKLCHDAPYEAAINKVLADGKDVRVFVKRIGQESYMYLNSHSGKSLMTLVRHNLQFLNGQWRVSAINGKAINDDEANVFIDIPSLKIHGNTGCNYFNGEILVSPDVPNSISFSGMGVTRMACPKGDQERLMLVALEETVSAVAVNDDTVAFANSDGAQVLTLKRISKTE